MRGFTFGLALAGLFSLTSGATAQQAQSAASTLRFVSGLPGQEVSFRVEVEHSEAGEGRILQLLSSAAVYRHGDHVELVTPAELLLTSDAAFQVSFSAAHEGDVLRLLLPTRVDGRMIDAAGTRIAIARPRTGAPIELRTADTIEVRKRTSGTVHR